jgi:cysteine desulfurase
MTINGGKIYGPKQSGLLYARTGTQLLPLIVGGGQERGLRSGTENVAASVGLAKALEKAVRLRRVEAKRVGELRKQFLNGLGRIPGARLSGARNRSSPHIVSAVFAGYDNERLMMELDELGVQAAVGSACSAANLEPSHVLRAMGLSAAQARSSLRFSFGRATSQKNITSTLAFLGRLTAE